MQPSLILRSTISVSSDLHLLMSSAVLWMRRLDVYRR